MSKIPTAEEFLQDHFEISHFYDDKTNQMVCFSSDVQKAMIEFAKLHVEAALEHAALNSKVRVIQDDGWHGTDNRGWTSYRSDEPVVDKQAILNAYPLTNIK